MTAFAVDFSEEEKSFVEAAEEFLEAQKMFQEFTMAEEFIFEASQNKKDGMKSAKEQELSSRNANNEAAAQKSEGALKKLWDSVMAMLKKLKDAIKNTIDRAKLDKDEKAAYDAFREACKQDPSLKNAKISVVDFKKMQSEYEALSKELDDEYKLAEEGKERPLDDLIQKVADFGKNTAKGALASVNAVSLVNMAGTNSKMAKMLYDNLHADEDRLNKLKSTMGEKQYKKFDKQMKSLSREVCGHQMLSITRLKLKLTHRYYDDCISAYASGYQDLYDLAKGVIQKKGTHGTMDKPSGTQNAIKDEILNQNQYTSAAAKLVGDGKKYIVKKGTKEAVKETVKSKLPFAKKKEATDSAKEVKDRYAPPSFKPHGGNDYRNNKK